MLSKAEKSYIQSSLLSNPPLRADGRTLHDFRTVSLQTDVAPLANGSARVNIGRNPGGGTEVLAAVKLDVDTIHQDGSSSSSDTVDGGRIVCTVSWFVSPPFFVKLFVKLTRTPTVLLQLTPTSHPQLSITSNTTSPPSSTKHSPTLPFTLPTSPSSPPKNLGSSTSTSSSSQTPVISTMPSSSPPEPRYTIQKYQRQEL